MRSHRQKCYINQPGGDAKERKIPHIVQLNDLSIYLVASTLELNGDIMASIYNVAIGEYEVSASAIPYAAQLDATAKFQGMRSSMRLLG